MLVAYSFDLWQKDTFFSAAEEVQESADIMESAYRTWDRVRREGLTAEALDELCRELQTALSTAKWQLEEFERAVRLSYRNCSEDFTTARHSQFVAVIEDQITRVETALREFFNEGGNQPLRWVKLNEEECDDLALFLSGTPQTSQTMNVGFAKLGNSTTSSLQLQEIQYMKKTEDLSIKAAHDSNYSNQTKDSNEHIVKLESNEIPRGRDDLNCQAERRAGTRRTRNSPDIGSWNIAIPDEDEQNKALLPSIEATPKEKGLKAIFSRQRFGDYLWANGGIISYTQLRGTNWINQILGWVGVRQRHIQSPQHLRFSCSVQFKLALVLTIFLIVLFVLYST